MNVGNIYVAIKGDPTPLEKAMRVAHDHVKTGAAKIDQSLKRVGTAFKVMGAAAAVAAAGGLVALNKGMKESIALANVQEEAEMKLTAVLRATGAAAGYNAKELFAMAGKMQGVTTVGDEVIISGMSILATFKQVREEGFERATMAALDMSAVMGTDLNSSIMQIGKALNDPIKGISALTRVGVTFTEQQKDQIKVLQESGDIMAAQGIILDELESQFSGVAASLRGTFAGAVTAAGNAFGDLKEQIGFAVTKNEFFIEAARIAEQIIIGWTDKIKENQVAMNDFAKSIGVGLVNSIGGAVQAVGFFHTGWLALLTVVPVLVDAFHWWGDAVFRIIRQVMIPLDAIMSGLEKVAGYVGNDFINPFSRAELAIDNFGQMTQAVMEDSFQAVIDNQEVYAGLDAKISAISDRMAELGTSVVDNMAGITSAAEGAVEGMKNIGEAETYVVDISKAAGKEYVDFWQLTHNDRYAIQSRALDAAIQLEAEKTGIMRDMWGGFTSGLEANFATVVGDGLRGQFDSIGAAFKSLMSNMLSTFIGTLAKMAAQAAASGLIDFFSGGIMGGGLSSSGGLLGTAGKVLKKVPIVGKFFADGGHHKGGWRIVGERGPELEYTGPSQIFSNPDTMSMLTGAAASISRARAAATLGSALAGPMGGMVAGGSRGPGPGDAGGTGAMGYAHTGGYLLAAGEGRLIAQTGEGVLSRVGMKNLDALNTGKSIQGGGNESSIAHLLERILVRLSDNTAPEIHINGKNLDAVIDSVIVKKARAGIGMDKRVYV